MLNPLLPGHWLTLHSLVAGLGLVIYLTTSHARRQHRHPSAAIAWVVSLALLPYLVLPLYLLLGSRKVVRESVFLPRYPLPAGRASPLTHRPDLRFQQLARALGLPSAAPYTQLDLHEDGEAALSALSALIRGAEHSLDLCTFILGRDTLGNGIAALLAQQARAGVRVRLLIDGVGRYMGGRPDLAAMRAAGVTVVLFVSPFTSPLPGRTNLRNHRKLAIADGARLWTGGRNLAAEYFMGEGGSPWIDLSFELQGPVVQQAQARFVQDWAFATQNTAMAEPDLAARVAANPSPHKEGPLSADACAAPSPLAQLIASGPDQVDDTLYSLLISACFSAQSRITVVTPYFVPDPTLLMALTLAARRGVAVTLLLPRQSNHRLADVARRAALRDMAAAGAKIWLLPGMVHAKAIVIDDELALAGSANLDERSMFLNYELMFAFFETGDVQRFASWIERQRAFGVLYQAKAPGVVLEFTEGLVRWLAFQL